MHVSKFNAFRSRWCNSGTRYLHYSIGVAICNLRFPSFVARISWEDNGKQFPFLKILFKNWTLMKWENVHFCCNYIVTRNCYNKSQIIRGIWKLSNKIKLYWILFNNYYKNIFQKGFKIQKIQILIILRGIVVIKEMRNIKMLCTRNFEIKIPLIISKDIKLDSLYLIITTIFIEFLTYKD